MMCFQGCKPKKGLQPAGKGKASSDMVIATYRFYYAIFFKRIA